MRRLAAKAAVYGFIGLTVGAGDPALAGDAVLLPYTCSVKAGRPVLKVASSPIRHEIIGSPETRAFTACRQAKPSNCTNVVVYRFSLRCGSRVIDWQDLAVRLEVPGNGRSWIQGDQFHLVVPPDAEPGTAAPASERERLFVLPAGFAPVEEIGARLESETVRIASTQAGQFVPAVLDASEAAGTPATWRTHVELATSSSHEAAGSGGMLSLSGFAFGLVLLVMTTLLVALGWYRQPHRFALAAPWMRRDFWTARMPTRALRGMAGGTFGNGIASASAMLEQAETAVSALAKVGPLRDTLSAELRTIRQRLSELDAAPGAEGAGQVRTAAGLRGVIRDLERIRRIADSAAASLVTRGRRAGASAAVKVPTTPAEAYDLLGVNPNVSEAALKKIVDGLRMSWHPDLSDGEADRLLREDRTKQINIAWDLIVGKRAA